MSLKAGGKRRDHDYDITALRPGDVDVAKPEGKGQSAWRFLSGRTLDFRKDGLDVLLLLPGTAGIHGRYV